MQSNQPTSSSVWAYKPWWCQPWSILLTTAGVIGGSWGLFHTIWITIAIAIPMLMWAIYFVGIYPRQVAQLLVKNSALAHPDSLSTVESDAEN